MRPAVINAGQPFRQAEQRRRSLVAISSADDRATCLSRTGADTGGMTWLHAAAIHCRSGVSTTRNTTTDTRITNPKYNGKLSYGIPLRPATAAARLSQQMRSGIWRMYIE